MSRFLLKWDRQLYIWCFAVLVLRGRGWQPGRGQGNLFSITRNGAVANRCQISNAEPGETVRDVYALLTHDVFLAWHNSVRRAVELSVCGSVRHGLKREADAHPAVQQRGWGVNSFGDKSRTPRQFACGGERVWMLG